MDIDFKDGYPAILSDEQVAFLKSAGFPTVDEFMSKPDSYKESWEDIFSSIENGPELLKNHTKGRHVLRVCGKKVESLGQMIRVARDMGFNLENMTYTVNLEAAGDGKYIHHIDLIPKSESPKAGA